jgi:hypothetical protein
MPPNTPCKSPSSLPTQPTAFQNIFPFRDTHFPHRTNSSQEPCMTHGSGSGLWCLRTPQQRFNLELCCLVVCMGHAHVPIVVLLCVDGEPLVYCIVDIYTIIFSFSSVHWNFVCQCTARLTDWLAVSLSLSSLTSASLCTRACVRISSNDPAHVLARIRTTNTHKTRTQDMPQSCYQVATE